MGPSILGATCSRSEGCLKYLGALVTAKSEHVEEIKTRIATGVSSFFKGL